jgi:hypothetical protein
MMRAAGAVAMVLALAGCATVTAPPAGLTAAEIDEIRRSNLNRAWAETGLYPDERPAAPIPITLPPGDQAAAFTTCMNNAGFDNYRFTQRADGSIMMSVTIGEESEGERLTRYICQASFEREGQYDQALNDPQLDYLYDYHRDVLVPCLEQRGFEVENPPTRGEFHSFYGSWHPYYALSEDDGERLRATPDLLWRCPPMPPGIPDPGFAAIWDG